MGIIAERRDTFEAYKSARFRFLSCVIGGPAVMAVILLIPKYVGPDSLRLILAMCFLGALTTTILSVLEPFSGFLAGWIDLALEDMGPEHRKLGYDLVNALRRWAGLVVWPLLAAIGFLSLCIIAYWPVGGFFAWYAPLLHLCIWLSLAFFPYQLLRQSHRLKEAIVLRRQFQQQIKLSSFRPVTIADAIARDAQLALPAVSVTGPYRFTAGGFPWRWEDFQQNSIIFGKPGSGKTVTILNALLDGLLSSANGDGDGQAAAALILDPKGDYREKIATLCARLGRSSDLLTIDPTDPAHMADWSSRPGSLDRPIRWNPLDSADDAIDMAVRFAGLLQLLGMKDGKDPFWVETAKIFIQHAISLLRATEPASAPPTFAGISELATQPMRVEARIFILHAKVLLASSGEETFGVDYVIEYVLPNEAVLQGEFQAMADPPDLSLEALQTYFARWKCRPDAQRAAILHEVKELEPQLAGAPPQALVPGNAALQASEYLGSTWVTMPQKTRSIVEQQLTNMITPFLSNPYRTAFSGKSSFTLREALEEGKIIYVAMPAEEKSAMSQVINTLMKLEYYREVLRHRDKTRFSLFFCDEFQNFITTAEGTGDGPFLEKSRQSRHANVVATQNLSGLLQRVDKPVMINSLLGNCAVKLFLRNDETETVKYASTDVFGQYMSFIVTLGRGGGHQGGWSGFSESASVSEAAQMRPRVPPERFTALTIPDRESGTSYSEALVSIASRQDPIMERLRFKVHPLDE